MIGRRASGPPRAVSVSARGPLALAALAVLALGCAPAERAPIRHVVLISLDTTRADHLSPYGAPRQATPALAHLAAEGVVFRDVTAPAPTTLASHASLMTGTYPHTHGVPRNGFRVHAGNLMLAEMLRAAGFHTAAVLGSFALDRRFAFDQGFAHFDQGFDLLATEPGVDQNQRTADHVTDAALRHLDAVGGERLFLFVHYFDPHLPYVRAPDGAASVPTARGTAAEAAALAEAHQRRVLGRAVGAAEVAAAGLPKRMVERATGEPLPRDERLAELYAAEVAFTDREVGRLLDGLRERGVLDEALLIVTADHGETFWEHGDVWNHGLWVYQTTVSVPLVVRLPGAREAGRVVEQPVSTVDVVPTVLDLLGLDAPEHLEGVSLAPALRGGGVERESVFCEATQPTALHEGEAWTNAPKPACVREGPWKYVHAPYLELEELYHLDRDPGERRNLLRTAPTPEIEGVRARLAARLAKWRASARPLRADSRRDDDDTNARLRALGYIE